MLVAFDIGNTNITIGLFDGPRLVDSFRLETVHARTGDEYALLVRALLAGADVKPDAITGAIIASVVPILTGTIEMTCEKLFEKKPAIVGPGFKTGMPVLYNPPKDVGADRIVNGVAAFERTKSACIVVDFGTATTFDSITGKGEYAGGAIAPGLKLAMDALFARTAKLPKVDVGKPEHVVGKSTVESIQSGCYFGYVALVDGLVARMKKEMAEPVRVIGTGGLATVIAGETASIEEVDENLTLEGLRILYDRNRG
jgi:type III pantothenate kinase